jgi:hypothetical protein
VEVADQSVLGDVQTPHPRSGVGMTSVLQRQALGHDRVDLVLT